jgi:hypothetical protein
MKQIKIFDRYLLIQNENNDLLLQNQYNKDKIDLSYNNKCNIDLKVIAEKIINNFHYGFDDIDIMYLKDYLQWRF